MNTEHLLKSVAVEFDLYCHWSQKEPVYRVYVDDDLITERTFAWPGYQHFIRENFVIAVKHGEHNIRVENLNPDTAKFTVKRVRVDEQDTDLKFVVN
jgi:hypothetical protein